MASKKEQYYLAGIFFFEMAFNFVSSFTVKSAAMRAVMGEEQESPYHHGN